MSDPLASFLRLHVEPPPEAEPIACQSPPGLPALCHAFECATGWRLSYELEDRQRLDETIAWSMSVDEARPTAGQLCLRRSHGDNLRPAAIDTANASRLAAAIAELLNGRVAAERALWQREAELASCVPVITRRDEEEHLAARLEAVLKAAAEAIGCQAAGLYLLDADTTQLKLRSGWGLSSDRLVQPPRRLANAIGDLEALAGHAVVLEKSTLAEVWNLPEVYPAAVCVPVSTPTVPLGTLWLFSQRERPFSDADLHIAEIVSGRLAAELEREILLTQGRQSNQLRRQLAQAHELQEQSSRRSAPLIDGWEVAGWALQSHELGGALFDWSVSRDGALVCTLGEAAGGSVAAALIAQTVRSAASIGAARSSNPAELLELVNQTLWRQSSGDQLAALALATLHPSSGRVRCAWAGSPAVLHVREHDYELLSDGAQLLGLNPNGEAHQRELEVQPGEVIALCTPSLASVLRQPGHRLNAATLATLLMDHLGATAANLADLVRSCCESQAIDLDQSDRGVLVLKRR